MAKFNWPIGGGGKPAAKPARKMPGAAMSDEHEEMPGAEGSEHHEEIHQHLRNMHEATGHAHTHVEHHGDGTHTSHHIDEAGQVSGPHEHDSMEALKDHMEQTCGDEGQEQGAGGY